uniref:Ribosomal RNA methyltransferase FtsJ domain-containing protein n=1 Tax=Strombidium rassoulzadegani TaxID=1082188 RepID=A0A7S3CMU0_9SPIT|mmetsp:Transcript_17711/g.29961  ORF Transcript_17711/g.29961 Transcript_17711/m.29961 type:complete len:161 (+) Transcript_17711:359-841(+)
MGDITTVETAQKVLDIFKGEKAELIICDGAPDVTGFHEIDQYMQAQLLQAALTITQSILREGGTFIAKFFRGADLSYLDVMMKQLFKDVYVVKPESSRVSSAEAFVVGLKFRQGMNLSSVLSGSMKGLKQSLQASGAEVNEGQEEQEKEGEGEEEDVLTF